MLPFFVQQNFVHSEQIMSDTFYRSIMFSIYGLRSRSDLSIITPLTFFREMIRECHHIITKTLSVHDRNYQLNRLVGSVFSLFRLMGNWFPE